MAWEVRAGQRYYYRKRRVAGRVVSQYIGKSDALATVLVRERRRQDRACREALFDRHHAEFERRLYAVVRVLLLVDGAYRHHGEWRQRRGRPKR